ncbi:uncharacterized protein PpBr36_10511 [Pyricularia pennisetigena]|uniref:uncharacterized protein n=1 Tax=Pyricularia pennisetigena TaxID=1578925 RepID=UPI001154E3E4|nr:uncharacterized protein PpBr36_10511 [Pyricularia pennisetigena]TLS21125.1 hypothetical protein PpBr36_10511 [Pyricularia pennisetigena]
MVSANVQSFSRPRRSTSNGPSRFPPHSRSFSNGHDGAPPRPVRSYSNGPFATGPEVPPSLNRQNLGSDDDSVPPLPTRNNYSNGFDNNPPQPIRSYSNERANIPPLRTRSFSAASTVHDEASPVISARSWMFKEGAVPWGDASRRDGAGFTSRSPSDYSQEPEPPKRKRRPWYRIGFWGFMTIIHGTILSFAFLAFLSFLWLTKERFDPELAGPTWRWVMLGGRVTQAITLATVLIRIAVTTKAAVFTSLIACIMLEKHGVPLSQVAELSVLRCVNDGPMRLAWLLLTSCRKSPLLSIVSLGLILTTVAVQFSSTILVSDLDFTRIIGEPGNTSMPVFMNMDVINLNHQSNGWVERPTAYIPFGELGSGMNSTPTQLGVSDTGIVRKVFLPVSTNDQEHVRRYSGQAVVFNSRFVCMRPSVSAAAVTSSANVWPGTSFLPLFLSVWGNIDYEATFADAGMPLPPNCPGGSCFPSAFNCSLSQHMDASAHQRQGFTNSICMPDGSGAASSAKNFTLPEDEAVPAYAGVFLFFRSNSTIDLWRGPNDTALNGDFPLPNPPTPAGEWVTYERAVGGRMGGMRFINGGMRLDMSICFQQLTFDMSDVKVFSPRDLERPVVSWDSAKMRWDTNAVRRMIDPTSQDLGADGSRPNMLSPAERGTYEVESISSTRSRNMATYFNNKLINSNYNSPQTNNVSLFMDPLGLGKPTISPHVEYQVLFSDALNSTNRPGCAFQAVLTAMAGSAINEAIPQFNMMGNTTLTLSVSILTPRRVKGLIAVFAIVLGNMACGITVMALFFLKTKFSTRGNSWQAVSQLVSEHTAWLLEESAELTDEEIEKKFTRDMDPSVQIARSGKTGRVQVMLSTAVRQGK